eukprot:375257-Pelagomonas_calceolata.AAC.2
MKHAVHKVAYTHPNEECTAGRIMHHTLDVIEGSSPLTTIFGFPSAICDTVYGCKSVDILPKEAGFAMHSALAAKPVGSNTCGESTNSSTIEGGLLTPHHRVSAHAAKEACQLSLSQAHDSCRRMQERASQALQAWRSSQTYCKIYDRIVGIIGKRRRCERPKWAGRNIQTAPFPILPFLDVAISTTTPAAKGQNRALEA